MTNPNQRGTHKIGLDVIIGSYFRDSQNGDFVGILRMLAVLISGTQDKPKYQFNWDTLKEKKWKREDNNNVIHCYFKNKPTNRVYRKRMMIFAESAKFNASEWLVNQANLILKKGGFSPFEILEICGEVNCEEYTH